MKTGESMPSSAASFGVLRDVFDSFWRAAAYCLHPRVILWSQLPLWIITAAVLGLGWWYWEGAVAAVRSWLEHWSLMSALLQWLESQGADTFRSVVAPLIVVALTVPVIVLASLLLVAWLITPALVRLVAERRFAHLQRLGPHRAGLQGWAWSLGCTAVALIFLLLSAPLWLIPPLALVLPPLIWGWLAAKVLSFDTLATHATLNERRHLLHEHRWVLLGMGVLVGMLGSAPSLLWAVGALTLIFAPLLAVVSVWVYMLMFCFGTLWFAHFLLARLWGLRQDSATTAAAVHDNVLNDGSTSALMSPPVEAPGP